MTILTSVILSCLLVSTKAQDFLLRDQYYPVYRNPDSVVFPEQTNVVRPQGPQSNDDLFTQAYQDVPRTTVKVEKSNEISVTTAVNRPVTVPSQTVGNRPAQAIPLRQSTPTPAVSKPVGYNSHLYTVTNIGINLLKNINAIQSGNVVFSPYSISLLLALLQQGATGQTQQELNSVLKMTPPESAFSYSVISNDYKSRNSRNILRTANNVFVGDTFTINPDFKKVAQSQFDSDITPVSFSASAVTARQINNWVARKTNDQIKQLVSPDSIDSTTQLVLVNAIYFKGLWEIPFNPRASYDGQFQLSNGQEKPVQFMRMKRLIHYGVDRTTNAQVVVLPFEGNQYSMMVILPSQLEGVSRTLTSLSSERILSYLSFPAVETQLELPKFTVRADTDLREVLKNMGLTRMFGPYAELDGLGRYQTSIPQISSAVHSAVLSIDEHGAKAAAATSFAAVALSYEEPAQIFRAERPFIVVLWDTVTSLPLFMAKVEDPIQ